MNKIILGFLVLTSSMAFAVPPAGAPNLVDILPNQRVYQVSMAQLNPTGQVSMEFIDKHKLPDSLKNGSCQPILLSRSGAMVKVTVPISSGEAILYFGDIDSDPAYPVLCHQ